MHKHAILLPSRAAEIVSVNSHTALMCRHSEASGACSKALRDPTPADCHMHCL